MSLNIRRVAVLGSGVMGAQIASLIASLGIRVYLLDLVNTDQEEPTKEANMRSKKAHDAIANLSRIKPSPYYSIDDLNLIIPGNFEDDMAVISEVDWVIEAVSEKLDVKQSLHRRILEYIQPGIPVTTNTSGISLMDICHDFPEEYQKIFWGTHFFNPPRYMQLLEFIPTEFVDKNLFVALHNWCEENLGKGVVLAKDTVNFIANRIGVFSIQAALQHMKSHQLRIEEVDALTGKLLGRASSATFRTLDIVGIDTFALVARNVYDRAPLDPFRDYFLMPAWIEHLIASGNHGHKTKNRGFYAKYAPQTSAGKPEIKVFCSQSLSYADAKPISIPWLSEAEKISYLGERLKFILEQTDCYAQFIWQVLRDTFCYSALLCEEIADGNILSIDQGLRWGFNWQLGPFALWQNLGYDYVLERIQKEKARLPQWIKAHLTFYQPEPNESCDAELHLHELSSFNCVRAEMVSYPRRKNWIALPNRQSGEDRRIVISCPSASLLDIGDEVACLVFHSKMNTLNIESLEFIQKSIVMVAKNFKGLLIANYGRCFSAGADLQAILQLIDKRKYHALETIIRQFQGTFSLLKYAPFPVVSCPQGLTLGAGCELVLHTAYSVAYAEANLGLVESGVGLIPAGGGTKELALKAYDWAHQGYINNPLPMLQKYLLLLLSALTSSSAKNAVEMGLLPPSRPISLSKQHMIYQAKLVINHSLAMRFIPRIPANPTKVLGQKGISALQVFLKEQESSLNLSAHDMIVGEHLVNILCGGNVEADSLLEEQDFLRLERESFLSLCETKATRERIQHMLQTGRILRN